MQQPRPTGAPTVSGPSFYLTGRQPIRPGAVLLAIVVAVGALSSVAFGLGHAGAARAAGRDDRASRSPGATPSSAPHDDDKDDPDQVDTIVLGDPADAPVPARRGEHVSAVHATILIQLPRFGEQVGLIPDTPAGHLLVGWLAAFNQGSSGMLERALPNVATDTTVAAQMALRMHTGGFNLLSAKEVQPGVLVFRLRDQTPEGAEVLGTLQVRANSNPAAVASFSLRAVASSHTSTASKPLPSH